MTKSRLVIVLVLLVTAAGSFLAATVESILWPRQEVPEQVDAVVILAGGLGERVVFGLAAINLGLADTVIVSASPASVELCAGEETAADVQVICVEVAGGTDVEAAQLSAIAEVNGFRSLLLVTSSYHMQRAERWFHRCFDGEVYPLAADATPTRALIKHEVFATLAQVTHQHSCPNPST